MKINWIVADDTEEAENHRIFKMTSGGEVHFKRPAPSKFWVLNYGHGALPNELKGKYLTFSRAEAAVRKYLRIKGEDLLEEIPLDAA